VIGSADPVPMAPGDDLAERHRRARAPSREAHGDAFPSPDPRRTRRFRSATKPGHCKERLCRTLLHDGCLIHGIHESAGRPSRRCGDSSILRRDCLLACAAALADPESQRGEALAQRTRVDEPEAAESVVKKSDRYPESQGGKARRADRHPELLASARLRDPRRCAGTSQGRRRHGAGTRRPAGSAPRTPTPGRSP